MREIEIVVVVARIALAATFAFSALAKLGARTESTRAVANFGVPPALAKPLAAALPFAELATAILLCISVSALWGGIAALLLLLAFSAAIAWNLARGNRPECRCFGNVDSGPIGPRTLIRNAVLIALAALVTWQGLDGNQGSTWQFLGTTGVLTIIGLVAGQALIGRRLLCENDQLRKRVSTLTTELSAAKEQTTGSGASTMAVPDFVLENVDGDSRSMEEYRNRPNRTTLLFVGTDCWFCRQLAPDLVRWRANHGIDLNLVFLSEGSAELVRDAFSAVPASDLLVDATGDVARAFGVRGHPSAVILDPAGSRIERIAPGSEEIIRTLGKLGGIPIERQMNIKQRIKQAVVRKVCG